MKAKLIFALMMGFVSAAFAGPSLDRVTLDQQIRRAQQENKKIVMEVGAAWCGPCNQFAFDLHKNPAYMSDFASRGYIFMKVESEKIVGSALNVADFIPSIIHFFPSFYQYTPGQGWKFIGVYNTYASLVEGLAEVDAKDHFMTIDEMKAYFAEVAARPGGSLDEGPGSYWFNASLMDIAANYDYAQGKAILATLRESSARYPKLGLTDWADQIEMLFLSDFVAYGKTDFATLSQEFPQIAQRLSDLSVPGFSNRLFGFVLAGGLKRSDLATVAAQCSSTWNSTRPLLVKGSLSDADFQARLANLDLAATVLCADLEIHVTGATDSVKQRIAQLDQTKIADWYVLSMVGNKDQAVALYKKQYANFSGGYEAQLKQLKARLEKAVQEGNQKLIQELTAKIEVLQYQADHHAEVDAVVEAALRESAEIRAVEVFN